MKAIGYHLAGPITAKNALVEFEAPEPEVRPRDVLVNVKAVSVNPVDTKVRANVEPESGPKIIGYDAAGIVLEVGNEVSLFRPGDEVYYAGDLTRPGTNAERHAVDERIVGKKPASLSFVDAAALPLTAITAWEMLFDSFRLQEGGGQGESILITGGAGGVGSIMIQLARALTQLTVVATASRPATTAWVKDMGAHHVVNHRHSLAEQCRELDVMPRYVASLTATHQHFPALVDLAKPRGYIGVIDDPAELSINIAKRKALSICWEFMFTRSMFETEDMVKQHELLNRVAELVDADTVVTTASHRPGTLSVETLTDAHALQESGRAVGKTVLDGL